MARLSDAFPLPSAYGTGKAPMLDLRYGGQQGYAPNFAEWVSNQAYIRKQMCCLLIEAPAGFQYLPEAESWVTALKQLVEVHPKSIDGFNSTLEVTTTDIDVGGGGEKQQDPTNVTRTRSDPSFNFVDKYGRPIQNFLQDWITLLIMDPDTKVPGVFTLEGTKPADMLADQYGATMLFFEPDPTHTIVTKAWLTTNMYPTGTGDIIGKRDLAAAGEESQLTIKFTGISQTGVGVRNFAQGLLDSVNFNNANPYLRPSFVSAIDPNVLAASARGWAEQIDDLGGMAVMRG